MPQFRDSIEISRPQDVEFKGLAKFAGPIAGRDVTVRWATSLQKLRDQVHAAAQQAS